jgi:hypothetical protein
MNDASTKGKAEGQKLPGAVGGLGKPPSYVQQSSPEEGILWWDISAAFTGI